MFGNDNNFSGDSSAIGGGSSGGNYVPLIDAAATIGSALIQRNESKKSAQRNVWNAKEIADYEFQKNKEMWELQNLYNSPGQQMMRLGQAGLNPNLVYGSGSAAGNTSGSAPSYKGRTTDMSYTPLQIPQVLSQYQNFQMRQAQINNVKAATDATRTRTANEQIRSGLLELQGRKGEFELGQKQTLAPYQVDKESAAAEKARVGVATEMQRLQNMTQDEKLKVLEQRYKEKAISIQDIEKEKKQAEALFLQYKNQLRESGIHEGDNIILRMIIRMANEAGFNPMEYNPLEILKEYNK